MTAIHWLKRHRPNTPLDIRLTERDESTCNRLRQALGQLAHAAKEKSFLDELGWLTGGENLVLLVDPFGCVESFGDSDRGIGNGLIDHATVTDVLRRCAKKERAVISFWWGFARALGKHHLPTCKLLTEWAREHDDAVCRVFHDGRNHANALVGVGGGADVVKDVPNRGAWAVSWLEDAVYERA